MLNFHKILVGLTDVGCSIVASGKGLLCPWANGQEGQSGYGSAERHGGASHDMMPS